MKLALFLIALVAISFSAQAQGQNAWGFHHVINDKKFKNYKQVKNAAKDQTKYIKYLLASTPASEFF